MNGSDCLPRWLACASTECAKPTGGTRARGPSSAPTPRCPTMIWTMSFKGIDRVSLLTLEGRVLVPFLLGSHQAVRGPNATGNATWCFGRTGSGS